MHIKRHLFDLALCLIAAASVAGLAACNSSSSSSSGFLDAGMTSNSTSNNTSNSTSNSTSSNNTTPDTGMTDPDTDMPDPCEGVTCNPGEMCVDGTCVGGNDPCEGVTCNPGQMCVDGTCVDAPDPCEGVTCPDGQVCSNGMCVGENDPCANVTCDPGQTCVDGVCMGDPDPCLGVVCDPGQMCVDGVCMGDPDPCEGVMCPDGQVCIDGTCEVFSCQPDPREPDNALNQATVLTGDNQVLEQTYCLGDMGDWFELSLENGQSAVINVLFSNDVSDLDANLYEEGSPDVIRRGFTDTDNERLVIPAVTGNRTFYIEVYDFFVGEPEGPQAETPYTLQVLVDPPGGACLRLVDCDEGLICPPETNVCSQPPPECQGNGDCSGDEPFCSDAQQCVECLEDNNCMGGGDQSCLAGRCYDAVCAADPFEPNDTLEEAMELAVGVATGMVTCDGDEDWYALTVENEGDDLYIKVLFEYIPGNEATNISAQLRDSDGNLVTESASRSDNEYISGIDLSPGRYFLRVYTGADGTPYSLEVDVNPSDLILCTNIPQSGCPDGLECREDNTCRDDSFCLDDANCDRDPMGAPVCNLDTNTCAPCMDDMFEPNDTEGAALNLNGNLGPHTNLNTCGDEDYYSFTVTSGQTIVVEATFSQAIGDLDMALSGPDRDGATSLSPDDNERIEIVAVETGVYILRVFGGFQNQNYNRYDLNITIE